MLIRRFFFLLTSSALLLGAAAAAAGSQQQSNDASSTNNKNDLMVSQAIAKSREHLSQNTPEEAPYAYPKTRYRLALMLEETDQGDSSSSDVRDECILLYQQAAQNVTSMPGPMRVDAFHRAARLLLIKKDAPSANDDDDHESNIDTAENLLRHALGVRGDGDDAEELYAAKISVFESLVFLLLNDKRSYDALVLCQHSRDVWPDEPFVDELEATVHRRMLHSRDPNFVSFSSEHNSLASAAQKTHQALLKFVSVLTDGTKDSNKKQTNDDSVSLLDRYPYGKLPSVVKYEKLSREDQKQYLDLVHKLFRIVFLAACSARDAGLLMFEEKHFDYGLAILSAHQTDIQRDKPDMVTDFLINLGIRHKRRARDKVAGEYFRQALEVTPGDGHALAQLASIGEAPTDATSLSKDYVEGLFNGYAYRFENELVNVLGYRGHEFVVDALFRNGFDETSGPRVVIDLGCGTGLAGRLLRERIEMSPPESASCSTSTTEMMETVLLGVDLSPNMVKRARAAQVTIQKQDDDDTDKDDKPSHDNTRLVYDKVDVGEAVEFLQSQLSNSVDAILASDVLIYIGALDELLAQCSRVLKRSGGRMIFTVESHPKDESISDTGITLLKSGRFGHTKEYIAKLAEQTNFRLVEWKDEVLRKQAGKDVKGAVVTLLRKDDERPANSSIE